MTGITYRSNYGQWEQTRCTECTKK